MENDNVRQYAKDHRVKLWQIANQLGISEATMTRMMRVQLSEEKQKLIMDTVDSISAPFLRGVSHD